MVVKLYRKENNIYLITSDGNLLRRWMWMSMLYGIICLVVW